MGYKLPSVERMRNSLIPNIVDRTKQKAMAIIDQCTCFTIILDIWSSKNMDGYIGFQLIGVSKYFERYHIFLGVKKMTERHTANNVLAEYESMVQRWNIPIKLISNVSFGI